MFVSSDADNHRAYLIDWKKVEESKSYQHKIYAKDKDNIVLLSYKHKATTEENKVLQSLFYLDTFQNKIVDCTTGYFGNFEKTDWCKESYVYFDRSGIWKDILPKFELDMSREYGSKIRLHSRFKFRDAIKPHINMSFAVGLEDWTWGVSDPYLDPAGYIRLYSDKPNTVENVGVDGFTIRLLFEAVEKSNA